MNTTFDCLIFTVDDLNLFNIDNYDVKYYKDSINKNEGVTPPA